MTIDGVKCDRGIIDASETAVKAKGDGRVSKEDAEKVFAKAAEGFKVTRCARWTLRYCLAHFKWTEAAVTYLDEQMKAATQEDDPVGEEPEEPKTKKAKSHYENVNGMKLDGSPNNIRNAAADCCIRCRMSRVKFCCTCEVYEEPATVPVPFRTHVWLSGKYRKIYESPIVVKASHAQM